MNQPQDSSIPEYETTSLYEAAYLLLKGIGISDIRINTNGSGIFVFPDTLSRKLLSRDFINDSEINLYMEKIRTLKGMITRK